MYKKWAKVDTCFSFNKPPKQEILHFLDGFDPDFVPKNFKFGKNQDQCSEQVHREANMPIYI